MSADTCKRGHAWTAENEYWHGGRRRCAACIRLRNARSAGARRVRNLAKFGLTVEAFNARLVAQQGRCAICGTTRPGGKHGRNFQVDHDHQTGHVRGLLCGGCNLMLGHAQDDTERLRTAAVYLEKHKGVSCG